MTEQKFNLNEKRDLLFTELKTLVFEGSNFTIEYVFEKIAEQDKEFIRLLKDEIKIIENGNVFEEWLEARDKRNNLHKYLCNKIRGKIDSLAGSKLTDYNQGGQDVGCNQQPMGSGNPLNPPANLSIEGAEK